MKFLTDLCNNFSKVNNTHGSAHSNQQRPKEGYMQRNAYTNDFKTNMISMLLTAIVAAVVTIALATAMIHNKIIPSASAEQLNSSPAVTTAAATSTTPSCTVPSTTSTSTASGSGVTTAVATLPFMHSSNVTNTQNATSTTSTNTNTTTTNHNNGNLVSVSDNNVLNNLLNGNTILSGNQVSALNDVADVTNNKVTANVLSDLVDATTNVSGVTAGVLGVTGL